MSMKAHVICCNDGIEFVVIDDKEKAKEKLAELRDAYYERNKFAFENQEAYKSQCYWHIYTVKMYL